MTKYTYDCTVAMTNDRVGGGANGWGLKPFQIGNVIKRRQTAAVAHFDISCIFVCMTFKLCSVPPPSPSANCPKTNSSLLPRTTPLAIIILTKLYCNQSIDLFQKKLFTQCIIYCNYIPPV